MSHSLRYKINNESKVAVDLHYYWQPIETCPIGIKVQILSKHGVARYDVYTGKQTDAMAWAPLPKIPKKAQP